MAFIYPLPVHWIWNPQGWLKASEIAVETRDFAGAAVIHLVGGSVAFGLAILSKPRPFKFPMKSMRNNYLHKKGLGLEGLENLHNMQIKLRSGYNLSLAFVGFILTFIGQLCFMSSKGQVAFNCLIGITGSIFSTMTLSRILTKQWSLYRLRGGLLTGLVALSACADEIQLWAAFIIGFISGLLYILGRNITLKCRIDDPLDVISIHGLGGLCGLLLSPLISNYGIILTQSQLSAVFLGWNLVAIVVVVAWSLSLTLAFFGPLALCEKLGDLEMPENNVQLREIMPDKSNMKCPKIETTPKPKKNDSFLKVPRMVLERPSRAPSQASLTVERPNIAYSPSMMSKTMPIKGFLERENPDKFMTISRNHRSKSYINLDEVFDEPKPELPQLFIEHNVVPITITPGRPSRKFGMTKSPSPRTFQNKEIPRAPILRLGQFSHKYFSLKNGPLGGVLNLLFRFRTSVS